MIRQSADPAKHPTRCWRDGCDKPVVAKFKLDFTTGKTRCQFDGKFCREHFIDAWLTDVVEFVAKAFVIEVEK